MQARVRDVYIEALEAQDGSEDDGSSESSVELGAWESGSSPASDNSNDEDHSDDGGDNEDNDDGIRSSGGDDDVEDEDTFDMTPFRKKMIKVMRPAIEAAINWAWKDGRLKNYGNALPSNITVFGVVKLGDPDEVWAHIEGKMDALAQRWRKRTSEFEEQQKSKTAAGDGKALEPPVIFGFAIVFHKLILVHRNLQKLDATTIIEAVLDMETDNQRQWYSMVIMMTICWARDILMRTAAAMNLEAAQRESSSDPDA
jgi:hypothetical protein